MRITNLRFNPYKLLGDLVAIACAFVAFAIAGGSIERFGHLLVGLFVLAAAVALVVFVIWGILQRTHIWASALAAIVLVVLTVVITLYARSVVVWWFHLLSIRAVVGMIVFAFGLAVTVWSFRQPRSRRVRSSRSSHRRPADTQNHPLSA